MMEVARRGDRIVLELGIPEAERLRGFLFAEALQMEALVRAEGLEGDEVAFGRFCLQLSQAIARSLAGVEGGGG